MSEGFDGVSPIKARFRRMPPRVLRGVITSPHLASPLVSVTLPWFWMIDPIRRTKPGTLRDLFKAKINVYRVVFCFCHAWLTLFLEPWGFQFNWDVWRGRLERT